MGFYAMHGPVDPAASAGVWVDFLEASTPEDQRIVWIPDGPFHEKPGTLGFCPAALRKAVVAAGLGASPPLGRRHAVAAGPGDSGGGHWRGSAAGSTDSDDAGFDCPGGKGAETQGPRLTAPHRKNTSGGMCFFVLEDLI